MLKLSGKSNRVIFFINQVHFKISQTVNGQVLIFCILLLVKIDATLSEVTKTNYSQNITKKTGRMIFDGTST